MFEQGDGDVLKTFGVPTSSAPLEIEAYDAEKLGALIYSANVGSWPNSGNNAFLTAMEPNGQVYVWTYQTIKVFGLTR